MTVISGRKCSEQLTKSGPLGSLVRTLLESPLWWRGGYYLKWDAVRLCSERKTIITSSNCERNLPLSEFAEILKTLDIPSNRCLYRLRLSVLPTKETGCSLLLTPTAVMTKESPEKMRARAKKNGYKNGTKYGSLESQVVFDPKFKPMLKTPSAFDAVAERMRSRGVSGTSGSLAQEMMSGYIRNRAIMLPTPTAIEGEKYTNTFNPNSQMGQSLSAMAGSGMLPTPTSVDVNHKSRVEKLRAVGASMKSRVNGDARPNGLMDYLQFHGLLPTPRANKVTDCDMNSKKLAARNKSNIEEVVAKVLLDAQEQTSCPKTDGNTTNSETTSRLSPLFTEDMMGFPFGWTTFPFLSQNGGGNH